MNRQLSLLGLAKKAGKLAVGGDAVSDALHGGRAQLVLAASDAAGNTLRRVENRRGDIPLVTLPWDREALGAAIGYKSCAVAAICDAGFVRAFRKAGENADALLPGDDPGGGSYKKPGEKRDIKDGGAPQLEYNFEIQNT